MWIELTELDVATGLTGPELTAAKTIAKATAQTDPVAAIIEGVTREVRSRVAACASNTLGEGATIPDECKDHAVSLCVFRLAKRFPKAVLLDEDRRAANTQAIAYLRDVAACEVAIVPPTTAADDSEQAGGSSLPRVERPCRQFTDRKQDGI